MVGETDLQVMLASMQPEMDPRDFVFCTLSRNASVDFNNEAVLATVREAEGLSVVLDRQYAEELGVAFESVFRKISLTVHSSLEAVGLTAAFATALGDACISANVIAGHYHDHILVGKEDADRAVHVLRALSQGQSDR